MPDIEPEASDTASSISDVAWEVVRAAVAKGRERLVAYQAYMDSPAWTENPARLAELEAAGHRCRVCDDGPPRARLEVHHRSYRNFGRERVEDLTALCGPCHRAITAMLRERRADPSTCTPRRPPRLSG